MPILIARRCATCGELLDPRFAGGRGRHTSKIRRCSYCYRVHSKENSGKRGYLGIILTVIITLLLPAISSAQGNLGSNSSPVVNRQGIPLGNVKIAVCQPLATTAASVTNNQATLTMASNPITAGFVSGMPILVAGFTGGDTYLNAGTLTNGQIVSGWTILNVSSTSIVFAITHANASAGTNGTVLQEGNGTTSCAGLSSIFQDPALAVPSVNPITSDQLGNWNVFAASGFYDVQFYSPSTVATMKVVGVPLASLSGVFTLLGNNTTTGNNTNTGVNTFTQPVVGSITGTAASAMNLIGPGTVSGNYSFPGTTTLAGLQCKNVEGVRCIDPSNSQGWSGTDLSGWVASAFSACGGAACEVQVFGPGTYSGIAGSITYGGAAHQSIKFIGNPTLSFALGGGVDTFTELFSTNGSSIIGNVVIQMNSTGRNVFAIHGGNGWRIGSKDSYINVFSPVGHLIAVKATSTGEWSENFSVTNVQSHTVVAGQNCIDLDSGNFVAAGFINTGTFDNVRCDGMSTTSRGVHFNYSNSVDGTDLDFSGLLFLNNTYSCTGTAVSCIYADKTGSATPANPISAIWQAGEVDQGSTAAFVDASAAAAPFVQQIHFYGTGLFSGAPFSASFGTTLLAGIPATADLATEAGSFSSGISFSNPLERVLWYQAGGDNKTLTAAGDDFFLTSGFGGRVFYLQQANPATVGSNFGGTGERIRSSYWTGSVSANDDWSLLESIGAGANPTSTLTLSHSGSSGLSTFSLPSGTIVNGTSSTQNVVGSMIPLTGVTSQKPETNSADANVLTVTPPAVAGTYRACVSISVSSATAGVISWTLSWTDSNGNAQSNVVQDLFQDGTAAPATAYTTSAAGNYHFCREFDVNNVAANIVVKWVGGGTTAAKVSASIERLI